MCGREPAGAPPWASSAGVDAACSSATSASPVLAALGVGEAGGDARAPDTAGSLVVGAPSDHSRTVLSPDADTAQLHPPSALEIATESTYEVCP
mmetsp:Transcript_12620/g.32934  ORF Transcript_12620/g.32934 Transcript_12620/m.32934 type:complete len:94 (+) Transcript_12620:473-754(+)